MTRVVESRPILEQDLQRLAMLEQQGCFTLRAGDMAEILAIGVSPVTAISMSVSNSILSFLVTVDDTLVAVWGYGAKSYLSGVCYPWLLTTPAMDKHKMFFARASVQARDSLLERFHQLDVMVDARYLRAQAWLEWLGFEAHRAAVDVNGYPFIYMQLERKNGYSSK